MICSVAVKINSTAIYSFPNTLDISLSEKGLYSYNIRTTINKSHILLQIPRHEHGDSVPARQGVLPQDPHGALRRALPGDHQPDRHRRHHLQGGPLAGPQSRREINDNGNDTVIVWTSAKRCRVCGNSDVETATVKITLYRCQGVK